MKNFRKLKVWQQGIELVKRCYSIAKELPEHERFGLISQMTRAAVSIPSNIAEGCSRTSEKDFNRFLRISLGSAFELETLLVVVSELEVAEHSKLDQLKRIVVEEQKMLSVLLNRVAA